MAGGGRGGGGGGVPLSCFKSADPDVILTGAEPGAAPGSDTLRSYYFPTTFSGCSKDSARLGSDTRAPTVAMSAIKNSWAF